MVCLDFFQKRYQKLLSKMCGKMFLQVRVQTLEVVCVKTSLRTFSIIIFDTIIE